MEEHFDALAQQLEYQKISFINKTGKYFAERDIVFLSKENALSGALTNLESAIRSVEQSRHGESTLKFMSSIADKKKQVEQCKKAAETLSLDPEVQLPKMELNLCSMEEFDKMMASSNFVFTESDPLKCRAEQCIAFIDETKDISMDIDPEGIQKQLFWKINLTAQLHFCDDDSFEKVSVKKVTDKKYSLAFIPRKLGRHELLISYNNALVCRIACFVIVPFTTYLRGRHNCVKNACSITHHEGKLLLCQPYSAINFLNSSTLSVEETIEVPGVHVAFMDDPHQIYVTDGNKHRLIKVDRNGTIITSTGTKGYALGEFNFPTGLQIHNSEIYVCDTLNHRIQVFDRDLNFVRVIGRKGNENGCFNWPSDVGFDADGNLYVTDQLSSRIQVLTPQGQHIRNIGRSSTDAKELLVWPASLAIHEGLVYVTDYHAHRVLVFKTTGEFVKLLRDLPFPESIAVDDEGHVYVTCSRDVVVKC